MRVSDNSHLLFVPPERIAHSLEHAFFPHCFHMKLTFSRFCWQDVSPVQVVVHLFYGVGFSNLYLPVYADVMVRTLPEQLCTLVTHLKPLLIRVHILPLGPKVKKVQMPKAPKLIWLELSFNFFNLDFAHFSLSFHFLAFADPGPRRGRPIESGTYVILSLFVLEAKSFSIFCSRAVPEDAILKL